MRHLLACLIWAVLVMAGGQAQAQPLQEVRTVQWAAGDSNWAPVGLPDDWRLRGVARPGLGRYQLAFNLDEPLRPWSVWSSRWPVHHRVWLNGQLLSDTLEVPDSNPPTTKPFTLTLPVQAQRAGRNVLVIEELGGARAGLGTLWLGEAPAVTGVALRHQRLWSDVPRLLNGITAGTAVFALLLWAWRRREVSLAWYGFFVFVLSLRNFVVLEQGAVSPPGAGQAMVLFVAGFNLCLAQFAVVTALPGRWRWHVGLSAVPLAVAAGALALQANPAQLDQWRAVAYPLLTGNAVVALGLMGRQARRAVRPGLGLLVVTIAVVVGSGVFDFLLHSGRLPQHWPFCLPWTTPLVAITYSIILGRRLVRALKASEEMHVVLEQRVRERTAQLEAANTAKTRFLAAASHDLRQPMVTIGVLVGVLREQVVAPAQQRLISRVDEAVSAMEGLLAGLLDLSRLDSAGLRVDREPVALNGLLESVAAHEREAAELKGLSLRLRIPVDVMVLGDAVLIEQVLRNLVTNALRYTDRGGVLVGVRRRGAAWRIEVWDTGRGIPADRQAQVFEDFVQLDNPQRDRSQGLGLGLAIVRRAAALLGTQVSLRSRPGRGSCFSFELPALASGLPTAAQAGGADEPVPPLHGRCVGLVEDDAGAREAIALRLQAWGAEVVALPSPAALNEQLAAGHLPPLALLISDMRLPGASGLEVVARVRAAQGPVPAVIVTGNTAPEDLAELAASGLPVVHKPFRAEQLARAIHEVLTPR